jgi:hypothetical protein
MNEIFKDIFGKTLRFLLIQVVGMLAITWIFGGKLSYLHFIIPVFMSVPYLLGSITTFGMLWNEYGFKNLVEKNEGSKHE